jgi:hypothetical protein
MRSEWTPEQISPVEQRTGERRVGAELTRLGVDDRREYLERRQAVLASVQDRLPHEY